MNSVPSCCLPTLLDQVNANPTPIRGLVDGLIVGYGLHEFADHLGRHSGTVALGDHVTRHAIIAAAFCALHVAHLNPCLNAEDVSRSISRRSRILRPCRLAYCRTAPYRSASSQWMRILTP